MILLFLITLSDAESDTYRFISWEQCYYRPNFVIDEIISIYDVPFHFFTNKFNPYVTWAFMLGDYPNSRGFGWDMCIAGHFTTGKLLWQIPDFISLPTYDASVTGGDWLFNANYSYPVGPLTVMVFGGGGVSLNSFKIKIGEREDGTYITEGGMYSLLTLDYGLKLRYNLMKSLGVSIGYRGYLPWTWACQLEEDISLHPKATPYEITTGLLYMFK